MTTESRTALEQVYAAASEAELGAAYAAWAASYDRETAELGYCLPFVIAAFVARHVRADEAPILDAGCGTGLSGPVIKALGYRTIEGLDFSEEMLRIAKGREAYAALTRATLGQRLPWPDGRFAAVFSTGVFTQGHAPATSLHELARITRPAGHVVVTVRDTTLEEGGFRAVFAELEDAGKWRMVEESPPFRAFAIAEPEVLVRAFVFRIE